MGITEADYSGIGICGGWLGGFDSGSDSLVILEAIEESCREKCYPIGLSGPASLQAGGSTYYFLRGRHEEDRTELVVVREESMVWKEAPVVLGYGGNRRAVRSAVEGLLLDLGLRLEDTPADWLVEYAERLAEAGVVELFEGGRQG